MKKKANGTVALDKKIPIPESRGREMKYPWTEMELGDSFFVPGRTTKTMSSQVSVRARNDGRKYSVRAVEGGVRVWRIE